jgi:hypothetical protein
MILAAALALGLTPARAQAPQIPPLPGAALSLGAGRAVTARLTYDRNRAAEGGVILFLPGFSESDAAAARLAEALVLGSGGAASRGAAFARSHRIPAVAPESARWTGGILEAEAPVLGRSQSEGGVSFQVAERTVRLQFREGDVVTVDPVHGTLTLSSPREADSDLAAAEALRAYDGLRDAQALLHWWEARSDSDPRAGVLVVEGLAGRLADGSARAEDFALVRRAVVSALPPAEKKRLAAEERLALGEAAAAGQRALRDDLDSVSEAASALALERILARAQPRRDGLQSLAEALGLKAQARGAEALWVELGRAAQKRRSELPAGTGGTSDTAGAAAAGGLAACAAVAGATVPPRAVLDESFYRRFLAEERLEARLADIAADASLDMRRKSARLRALFLDSRIAPGSELGRDILGRLPQAEAYEVSGAYEDFSQVSRDGVLGKVLEAWAAGFDPGPLGARKRAAQGGLVAEPDSAVTIAAAVKAEVSGTAFSRDPASGRRARILVSAAQEPLSLEGGRSPLPEGTAAQPQAEAAQEYPLDRRTGRCLRPQPGGLLQSEELAALARAGRCLDDQEGRGVELEFCRAAGRLYLLGSRAMPGIDEEPARAAPFAITPPVSATVAPVKPLR